MISRVLAVMGWLAAGFAAFSLFTSNPFERALPIAPSEGADLNPLLQDFGLTIHPPILYTGYVGFSVAFAFALAALMTGRLDAAWARWSRPWTNVGVGVSRASASRSAAGGRTTNSAGAAGGSGIRSRMRRSCRG